MPSVRKAELMYICPVCGYEKLSEPAMHFSICSCCGTEFELDDFETKYSELRSRWIREGYRWFSPVERPELGWDPVKQLNNLQYLSGSEFVRADQQSVRRPSMVVSWIDPSQAREEPKQSFLAVTT